MFVVDAMHNIWEGLFRDLLGKLLNRPDGMGLWDDDESEGETSNDGGEGDESEGEAPEMGDDGDGEGVDAKRLNVWEELIRHWRFPRSVGPMMGKIGHKLSKLKVQDMIVHTDISFTSARTNMKFPRSRWRTSSNTSYAHTHTHTHTHHDIRRAQS
jgi:hypothetical protein